MGGAGPGPVGLTGPVTLFLTSAIPGLRSVLECPNLISSNSFAHRLGTGNSALRLTPGPVCDGPERTFRRLNIARTKGSMRLIDYWKQPLINEFSLVSMQTANRAGRQTQREKPPCGFYCCVHFSLRRKLSILRSSTGARTVTFLCVQWSAETRLENSVHSFRAWMHSELHSSAVNHPGAVFFIHFNDTVYWWGCSYQWKRYTFIRAPVAQVFKKENTYNGSLWIKSKT